MDQSSGGQRLIGRTEVIDSIVASLSADHSGGSLVIAEPGLGKTALAAAVVSALSSGSGLVRLAASRSLSTVPFGALAPFLNELSVRDITSPVAVIRSVLTHLKNMRATGSGIPLIVVDDAHVLDESSAGVLAQVAVAGAARLFALSRRTPGPPAELSAMWREGLLTRTDLEPLNLTQVHELCADTLDGPVLISAAAEFARASAGNPMFLLALIAQAQRRNHLVKRRGVWILSGEPPAADLRLSDLVKTDLMRLGGSVRNVLETVALAEPIPWAVLRQLVDVADVDVLEREKFIVIGSDADRLVRPAHPLYGEVVRRYMPAGRSIATRQRVIERMDTEPSSVDRLLRYVGWALESGSLVADRQLLRAATVANKLYQTTFALRAAEAITEPKYVLAATVEAARAHYTRGELEQAENMLRGIADTAGDLRTVASAALLSAQVRTQRGADPSELHLDVDAWSGAIERIATDGAQGGHHPEVQLSRIGSSLLRLYVWNLEGNYHAAEPELQAALVDPTGNEETLLVALTLLGEALTATGRPESGTEIHKRAIGMLISHEQRFLTYYQFVISRYTISLIDCGRWDELQALMTNYLEESPQTLVYFGGAVNLATGLVLVRQGFLHSALGQLSPAIEALREKDLEQLLHLALGLGAYSASLLGEQTLAQEYIDDFFRLPPRGSRQMYLLGQAHVVAARVEMRGWKSAGDELNAVALAAEASGMRSVQQVVLELSVRLGGRCALPALAEVAAANEGVEAALLFRYARAAQDRDASALCSISDDAAEARYWLLAADALAAAVAILQSQGNGQRARQVRKRLADCVARLEGIVIYPVGDADHISPLTRRERDIARLVVEGRSNREIAETASVSVRTVEGHLYRIFAKLDITRREDLAAHHIGRRS